MESITLPSGRKMIYDSQDRDLVLSLRWQESSGYARYQRERRVNGVRKCERIYLHRLIAGARPEDIVDHSNGDTLDNRRSNLRLTDRRGNIANSKLRYDSTSGFKGVTRYKDRWIAQVNYKGKHIHLGIFETAEKAAGVSATYRRRLFGEFAR